MKGDFQARFCERLGVKFPLPTRPSAVMANNKKMKTVLLFTLLLLSSNSFCQLFNIRTEFNIKGLSWWEKVVSELEPYLNHDPCEENSFVVHHSIKSIRTVVTEFDSNGAVFNKYIEGVLFYNSNGIIVCDTQVCTKQLYEYDSINCKYNITEVYNCRGSSGIGEIGSRERIRLLEEIKKYDPSRQHLVEHIFVFKSENIRTLIEYNNDNLVISLTTYSNDIITDKVEYEYEYY